MSSEQGTHNSISASHLDRRRFLKSMAVGTAALVESPGVLRPESGPLAEAMSSDKEVFSQRGYYIILSRMPNFGLSDWKAILNHMQEDQCNFLILWVGGGFRSRKFPITWQYNREHRNIENDFVRDLIDYGHSLGIKIVLGFTPFSYDGVNQYSLEHPELKAVQKDGTLAKLDGMDCWGYALNPSRPQAQKFMLEYASEMYFDFYPNADGLFIESSDYTICYCPDCIGHYYEREFEFIQAISNRVWEKQSASTIIVYPHYFSSAAIPMFGHGVEEKYDPRWTLFFTPHSAPIQKQLVEKASKCISWEPMVLGTPEQVKSGCLKAQQSNIGGLVFTLECYSFVSHYPEDDGNWHLIGSRMKPFGYTWLPDGADPYGYLLTRVLRIAFREFGRNPNLSLQGYRSVLKKEIFEESTPASAVDDLLEWQRAYVTNRTWYIPGPVMAPQFLAWQLELGHVKPTQIEEYQGMLEGLKRIRRKYREPFQDSSVKEMMSGIDWVLAQWEGKERTFLTIYPNT